MTVVYLDDETMMIHLRGNPSILYLTVFPSKQRKKESTFAYTYITKKFHALFHSRHITSTQSLFIDVSYNFVSKDSVVEVESDVGLRRGGRKRDGK